MAEADVFLIQTTEYTITRRNTIARVETAYVNVCAPGGRNTIGKIRIFDMCLLIVNRIRFPNDSASAHILHRTLSYSRFQTCYLNMRQE